MFGKKKKSVNVPMEEYLLYRDKLLTWEWMVEAFDTDKNKSIYKPTEKGIAIYSAIVHLVGKESLVNGYKLDIKRMEGLVTSEPMVKKETIKILIDGGVLTRSYDPDTDIAKYELTPQGASLFVSFFVSYGREVGTLPGDNKAKFFEIMGNMPKYSMKFSEIMYNIGQGFAGLSGDAMPGEAKKQPQKKYKKKQYKKNKYKKKPYKKYKTKRYEPRQQKPRQQKPQKPKDDYGGFSKIGDAMMRDL